MEADPRALPLRTSLPITNTKGTCSEHHNSPFTKQLKITCFSVQGIIKSYFLLGYVYSYGYNERFPSEQRPFFYWFTRHDANFLRSSPLLLIPDCLLLCLAQDEKVSPTSASSDISDSRDALLPYPWSSLATEIPPHCNSYL